MSLVRAFEEQSPDQGHQSLIKEASRFAGELGTSLDLSFPDPKFRNRDGEEVPMVKIKTFLRQAATAECQDKIQEERWQGKFLKLRWEDDDLNQRGCFAWMREWPGAPTHTIAGMTALYEQLTPTKLYSSQKTRTTRQASDTMCRLCGNAPESLPHVLAGCSALAQNKYLARHNAALQVLVFEMLRDLQLSEAVPPWHSPTTPKPLYESPEAQAF